MERTSKDKPIFTAHNVLFTILTISLLMPKAVLAIQGQSAVPNAMDLVYGVFIALFFYWLAEYRAKCDPRAAWYFESYFPSVALGAIKNAATRCITRFRSRQRACEDLEVGLLGGNFLSPGRIPRRAHESIMVNNTDTTASGVQVAVLPPELRRRKALHDLPIVGAPDDSDATTLPHSHVDYLAHEWREEDVWRSWRSMTKQKHKLTNGIRLENTCWRTWWKQRNKLGTVAPEDLNWLKDSDVTWLYGPLYTTDDWTRPPKPAQVAKFDCEAISTYERYNLCSVPGTKPILKHPSTSGLLTRNWPSSLFGLDQTCNRNGDRDTMGEHQTQVVADVHRTPTDGVEAGFGSDSAVVAITEAISGMSNVELSGNEKDLSISTPGDGKKSIVSFDPSVQQCIAVGLRCMDDEMDDELMDDELMDDEAMDLFGRYDPDSTVTQITIALLSPTTLKTGDDSVPDGRQWRCWSGEGDEDADEGNEDKVGNENEIENEIENKNELHIVTF